MLADSSQERVGLMVWKREGLSNPMSSSMVLFLIGAAYYITLLCAYVHVGGVLVNVATYEFRCVSEHMHM